MKASIRHSTPAAGTQNNVKSIAPNSIIDEKNTIEITDHNGVFW